MSWFLPEMFTDVINNNFYQLITVIIKLPLKLHKRSHKESRDINIRR